MTMIATAPTVTTRFVNSRAAAPVATAGAGFSADDLERWGFAVERDGIAAHEDTASAVVEAATLRGLRPILIGILADRREPDVARQRAFGRLTFALSA